MFNVPQIKNSFYFVVLVFIYILLKIIMIFSCRRNNILERLKHTHVVLYIICLIKCSIPILCYLIWFVKMLGSGEVFEQKINKPKTKSNRTCTYVQYCTYCTRLIVILRIGFGFCIIITDLVNYVMLFSRNHNIYMTQEIIEAAN